jgi:hypothetical protein
MNIPVKVEIINSDVILGKSVEFVHEFDEYIDAKQFVINFNSAIDPEYIPDNFSVARMVERRINVN